MLLEQLALSPLQVSWWQQTLEFWNTSAASPVSSLFHIILLDNIHDAFHLRRGFKNFSSLQSVGHSMPRDSDVAPVMQVAAIIEALREHLRGTHSHAYTVLGQPCLLGLSAAPTITGLDLLASVGDTVNCLCIVGICNGFFSSGLVLTICLLLLVGFPGTGMWQELTGCAHTVVAPLLLMHYT